MQQQYIDNCIVSFVTINNISLEVFVMCVIFPHKPVTGGGGAAGGGGGGGGGGGRGTVHPEK